MDNLNMSMKKQKEHSDRTFNDWIVVSENHKTIAGKDLDQKIKILEQNLENLKYCSKKQEFKGRKGTTIMCGILYS